MFSRAGTSHSLPQRAPSIQLSPSIPGSRCKLQRNNVLGRSPAGLPRRTEKKNRSRNTFARIDSPHTTQQLRFHLRWSNSLINRLVRSSSTKRMKKRKEENFFPLFQNFWKKSSIFVYRRRLSTIWSIKRILLSKARSKAGRENRPVSYRVANWELLETFRRGLGGLHQSNFVYTWANEAKDEPRETKRRAEN